MVTFDSLPSRFIDSVFSFLPQNDKLSLIATSKKLYQQGRKHLYENISISSNPTLESSSWYIGSTWTNISGLRGFHKRQDQNDYWIYLKLSHFITTLKTNRELGGLIKNFKVLDKVFYESVGVDYLNELLEALNEFALNLELLEISDDIKGQLTIPQITSLTSIETSDLSSLLTTNTNAAIKTLTINMDRFTESLTHPETLESLPKLENLILIDEEFAALRILKILSESAGVKHLKLKRLVFNHVHGLHDYNTVLRSLTIEYIKSFVDLSVLEELEMTIGCEENDCGCLGTFLDELAPCLTNLKKLALHEKTFRLDHYLTEQWDVDISRFMINLKSPSFKFVSITHNPPINGKLLNGFEGNYFRRRRLFEKVIPKLKTLETIISQTLLQTASCYEIVVSDILWNGCECEFCKKFLPFYDKYLMDHGYYDEEEGGFRDMIAPRLFGLANNEIFQRLKYKLDLDVLNQAPNETYWNFHGYDAITCFNDIENCIYDENFFQPLLVCVSHFFEEQVKYLRSELPNLKTVILSGIYFTIGNDDERKIECIYDKKEDVLKDLK